MDSDDVFCDVDSDVSDIGEEEKSSDIEEEERSVPEGRYLEESIEALEDFAQGIIKCFSKLPEDECDLCEEGGRT